MSKGIYKITLILFLSLCNVTGFTQDFHSVVKTLYESNLYHEAIDFLNQKEGPLSSREWKLKADCYHKMQLFDEANEAYNESVIRDDSDAEALARRGATYLELGEIGYAIRDIKKAIKVMPTLAEAYFYMGNICYDQGDNSCAKKNYNKAIEYRPNYHVAMYMLGAAKSNTGDDEGAVIAFESVMSEIPEAKYNLAVVELENENYHEVIRLFNELESEGFENIADLYFFRAEAYYYIGSKDDACSDYQLAGGLGDKESMEFYESYCLENGRKGKSRKRETVFISF